VLTRTRHHEIITGQRNKYTDSKAAMSKRGTDLTSLPLIMEFEYGANNNGSDPSVRH
jgi:hypothetical protein